MKYITVEKETNAETGAYVELMAKVDDNYVFTAFIEGSTFDISRRFDTEEEMISYLEKEIENHLKIEEEN
jgi:hypothetical protein